MLSLASSSFCHSLVIVTMSLMMMMMVTASPPSSMTAVSTSVSGSASNSDEQTTGSTQSREVGRFIDDLGEYQYQKIMPLHHKLFLRNPLLAPIEPDRLPSRPAYVPASLLEVFGSRIPYRPQLPTGNGNGAGETIPAGLSARHLLETRGGKQRFCGEMLVSALALVCKGNYRKRSSQSVGNFAGNLEMADDGYLSSENPATVGEANNAAGSYLDFFEVLKGASRNAGTASSGQLMSKLSKRGVVDDCCKKPCSTSTLGLYCSI